jgi:tetratricopeptide (TPR) repeat protein
MVKSPFYVDKKPLTRADELRDQLNELEGRIGRLGYGMGQEALTIPPLFDAVSATMTLFQEEGQAMRAEVARLEAVSAGLRRKAAVFLREIGGAGVLRDARRVHQPDPANWWWFLDDLISDRRRARLRKLLRLAGAVAATLILLIVLYQRFLAPDPATRARLEHRQNAERLVSEGDLVGALKEVEQALLIAPDDPYLTILQGTLQQKLGRRTMAEETFAVAEAALGDQGRFLLTRGQAYLLLDQMPNALADAEAVIALDPESASGFMLLGRTNELLGDYPAAVVAYEQAAALAEIQGDFQLAGTARVSMGFLMQRLRAQPRDDD